MAEQEVADQMGLIEIGVVVAGPLDSVDRRASEQAIQQVQQFLSEKLCGFNFELVLLRRSELDSGPRAEPSRLLQQAVLDRDDRHWDFVLVLTAAELISNYSPYCFAALSRPLDAAVFSLSLIDPAAIGEDTTETERVQKISYRLSRLMLHAIGHLAGLTRTNEPHDLMFHPAEASDLDTMHRIQADQIDTLLHSLAEIADQRLEEGVGNRLSSVSFAARAAWINRREIVQAIFAARPWEFPQRLSRLTIASVSTIVVLYMTAEAWDLALSQTWPQIAVLIFGALATTTAYVVVRQQLLLRRGKLRSEQMVVTAASALGIVLTGMLLTWTGLFSIGVGVASLLFHPNLIASWAASSSLQAEELGVFETCKMGLFVASLGLLIGALGASFEAQNYFRHVIFVDEEI